MTSATPAPSAFGLTVATPWYPTNHHRMAGSFVAEQARLAAELDGIRSAGGLQVVHGEEWGAGAAADAARLRPAFDATLDALRRTAGTRVSGGSGPVHRVPVLTVGGDDWGRRGEALVRDVRRALGEFASPAVHGHVGYFGGLLAARLAQPGARVVATEHSTTLRDVLAQPQARDHYAELIDRADAVFCVSELVRAQVLDRVDDPHGRVQVLANPVDFAGAPRRTSPPTALHRWVFIGGLIERKGVLRLARAFAIAARENPEVTLSMYGTGPLRDQVDAIAREAGVADRLHLHGVLGHRELLAELPSHDVLFAPSTYETFHLAVPEAVAAGLPVIVTRSGGPEEALAGVEDRVGRFVDVEESPDQLVDAWRDLSAGLGALDLDGARAELDRRYGLDAVRQRLARAYGVDGAVSPVADPSLTPGLDATRTPPERIVVAAVSSWRRFHVEAELDAARRLGAPTQLLTADPGIAALAAEPRGTQGTNVTVVRPAAVDAASGDGLVGRARRVAASVVGAARSGGVRAGLGAARRALPDLGRPRQVALLEDATLILADCQSMPLAAALLERHPGLRPVVELDRVGPLAPPPDATD
ncbi:glycosyltransferase involved in cell wall biosynthesis [Agromyces flavus]|uniref:Glycosyltransferase involved in cell wall biosynthesis n=2 Tax=Agromyces flavus TaxID=589382 RepID=A0ABT1KKC2_9MICO|nr:glycosyltransferase family 4 protein [Agromyces flavus]MCP2367324.1 glycosyltransferase involved in cell wall biosynthesis [Agromyces flavus]